jgi:hypothetical protein
MMKRRGFGKGFGKGYKNLMPLDSYIHSLSAKGISSKQQLIKAKSKFGTTGNFYEAGYITPEGELLDFSGKNDGGTPNMRSLDHRDISIIYDTSIDGTDALIKFQKETKSIRFGKYNSKKYGDSVYFDLIEKPNKKQIELMKLAIIDADDVIFERTDAKGTTLCSYEKDNPDFKDVNAFLSKCFK